MVFRPVNPAGSPPPAAVPPTPFQFTQPEKTGRLLVIRPKEPGLAFLDAQGAMVSIDGYPVVPHGAVPAAKAFATEHQFDAHFTCYGVLHPNFVPTIAPGFAAAAACSLDALSPELPRITKGALSFFDRVDQAQRTAPITGPFDAITPYHVVGSAIALDVDNPHHAKWTETSLAASEAAFAHAGQLNPLFAKPSLWYTTSGGCRYVWFLSHPIPVEGPGGLEDVMRGMVAAACIAGLSGDTNCKDWTRLYRFPRVRRADKAPSESRTQEQPYFRMSWGRVDTRATEKEMPAQVGVYTSAAMRPLSQMVEAEFAHSEVARQCLHDFRGRVGRDPGESRSGMANIRVGEPGEHEPAIKAELYQVLPNGNATTKPTAKAIRAKQIIEGLANPRSKDRKPLVAAQHAMQCLYEGRLLFAREADSSGWHDGAYALASNVCYCLRNELGEHEGGMTPQFIFALLFDPGRNANNKRMAEGRPDARSEDTVRTELWSIVKSTYRRYRFQRDVDQQEKDEEQRKLVADSEAQHLAEAEAENLIKAQLFEMVIDSTPGERDREKSREQSADPSAKGSWASAWVHANWRKHLILSCPKQGRAVLAVLPGGRVVYSELGDGDEGLYTAVRECGHNLINDLKPASNPGELPTLIPVAQIMRECGTQCNMSLSRVVASPVLRVVRGSDRARITYVSKAPGMRTDIEPVFHPGVDEWLHAIAGESVEKLKDWLACFTRIDHPIAGLYLQGAPGVGKGMLGEALTHLTEADMAAPFSQVVDQFQDTMIQTPFILGDEEGTSAHGSARSPMNMYKKVVTGEYNICNPKGKPPVHIEGHWRVLFAANNDKLLEWKGDVNESDMGAMIVRTLHIMCDEVSAKAFLKKIGGKSGTLGWPEKEIPQHIMWLTQHHKVVPGERLLVEGIRSGYHDDMALNTTPTQLVIHAIGHMLHADYNRYENTIMVRRDTHSRDWHVYVNLALLRGTMVSLFKDDASIKVPPQGSIREAVKALSLRPDSTSTTITIGNKRTKLRLWLMNMPHILGGLKRLGYDYDLRPGMGKEAWEALAPAELRSEVEDTGAPPALAPPPPPQRAPLQFPFGSSNAPPPPPRPAPPWPLKTKD